VIPVPAFPYNLNPYLVLGVAVLLAIVGARLRSRPDVDLVEVLAQSEHGPAPAVVVAPSTSPVSAE
jgi:hypothetical protein